MGTFTLQLLLFVLLQLLLLMLMRRLLGQGQLPTLLAACFQGKSPTLRSTGPQAQVDLQDNARFI